MTSMLIVWMWQNNIPQASKVMITFTPRVGGGGLRLQKVSLLKKHNQFMTSLENNSKVTIKTYMMDICAPLNPKSLRIAPTFQHFELWYVIAWDKVSEELIKIM